jgi:hypothetical protein
MGTNKKTQVGIVTDAITLLQNRNRKDPFYFDKTAAKLQENYKM